MSLSNPLPPLWESFQISRDALDVVRKMVIKKESKKYTDLISEHCQQEITYYQHNILEKTIFPMRRDIAQALKSAKAELNDLLVVGLWASFERFLRDYLEEKGQVLQAHVQPSSLGNGLYDYYRKEAERWKPDEILDCMAHSVLNNRDQRHLIEEAKSIYRDRNWVAHGKKPTTVRSSGNLRSPEYVFKTLDDIIEVLLLN